MLSKISLLWISFALVGAVEVVTNAWTQATSNNAYFVAVDSNDKGDVAYACAKDANGYTFKGGVYASKDYGVTFDVTSAPATQSCYAIATDSTGVYVAAGLTDGLYVSNDSGSNWKMAFALANASSTWGAIASSYNGEYMYASVVNANTEGGLYRSTDFGVTWSRIWSQGGDVRLAKSIATSASGQYVMVGTYIDGLQISIDYGASFFVTPLKYGYTYGMFIAVAMSASGQYLTASQVGHSSVFTSSDYGVSWTTQSGDFLLNSMAANANGDFLIGGYNNYGPIYTSTNFGVNWTAAEIKSMNDVATDASGKFLLAASPLKVYYYHAAGEEQK